MQRLAWLVGIALVMTGVAAPPAQAMVMLQVRMICDTDHDGTFGEVGEASGWSKIGEKGELQFVINTLGLEKSKAYECEMTCDQPAVNLLRSCTTNAQGRLNFRIDGVVKVGGLAPNCLNPTPVIKDQGVLRCIAGFGQVVP